MQVVFLKKFSKDLDKITQANDRKALGDVIKLVKGVDKLEEVPGVKKLTGFNDAFRIPLLLFF